MQILFYIFAAVAVIGALGIVSSRNVVHSALFLVLSFIGLALIYFAIGAPFLGAVQLMVYSGAVAILVVMAIMMTRRTDMASSNPTQNLMRRVVSALVAAVFFILMGVGVVMTQLPEAIDMPATEAKGLAHLMLGSYVLPFEFVAILLLIAMVGALILGRGRDAS